MNKVRFIALALILVFAANYSVMALSIEAQAVIDEMRERLAQRDAISYSVASSIKSDKTDEAELIDESEEYVPGRELRIALDRARSAIHRGKYVERARASVKSQSSAKASNEVITQETYRPGTLLAAAMERVRFVRTQYWPDVQMGLEQEVPPAAESQETALRAREMQSSSAEAAASLSRPSNNSRASLSKTPEFIEVDTAHRLEQRRQHLLRSKNLPDLSSPSEAAMIQASTQPDAPDSEQESKEFNRFISRYEYKMPSNYRIIVR